MPIRATTLGHSIEIAAGEGRVFRLELPAAIVSGMVAASCSSTKFESKPVTDGKDVGA